MIRRALILVGMQALLPGCTTTASRQQNARSVAILNEAGRVVQQAEYLQVAASYRNGDGEAEAVTMIFGPANRVRLTSPRQLLCYDGQWFTRVDHQTGQQFRNEMQPQHISPVLAIGTAMGGVTLPVPTARVAGGRWWREIYGDDASVEAAEGEVLGGSECLRIRIVPQCEDLTATWWIDRHTMQFRRVRHVQSLEEGHAFAAEYEEYAVPTGEELFELADATIPRITTRVALDPYVGQVITLYGEVTRTKIPEILGVDVSAEGLRGELAEATGILTRWTVSREYIDAMRRRGRVPAGRGAGTFYRLRDPNSEDTVKATRVNP